MYALSFSNLSPKIQWNMDEHAHVEPYGASHGIANPRAIGDSNIEPNKASLACTNCVADIATEQEAYAVSNSPAFWITHLGAQQEAIDLCAISLTDVLAQQQTNDGISHQSPNDFGTYFWSYPNTDEIANRLFSTY